MSDEMPGEAVQVAGPEFSDGVTVCGRTVTLVVGPFIGFILGLRSQFDHEPVSRDFGDDGCGGHGGAVPVALHFGRDFRRNRHVRRVEGVQRFGDVVVRSVEDRTDLHRLAVKHAIAVDAEFLFRLAERTQRGHAERVGDAPIVDFRIAGSA